MSNKKETGLFKDLSLELEDADVYSKFYRETELLNKAKEMSIYNDDITMCNLYIGADVFTTEDHSERLGLIEKGLKEVDEDIVDYSAVIGFETSEDALMADTTELGEDGYILANKMSSQLEMDETLLDASLESIENMKHYTVEDFNNFHKLFLNKDESTILTGESIKPNYTSSINNIVDRVKKVVFYRASVELDLFKSRASKMDNLFKSSSRVGANKLSKEFINRVTGKRKIRGEWVKAKHYTNLELASYLFKKGNLLNNLSMLTPLSKKAIQDIDFRVEIDDNFICYPTGRNKALAIEPDNNVFGTFRDSALLSDKPNSVKDLNLDVELLNYLYSRTVDDIKREVHVHLYNIENNLKVIKSIDNDEELLKKSLKNLSSNRAKLRSVYFITKLAITIGSALLKEED